MGTRLTTTEGILTIVATGEISAEEGGQILRDASARLAPDAPLLIDIRDLRAPGFTFADTYDLVRFFERMPNSYHGHIAVLDRYDETLETTMFFESASVVRGMAIRSFLHESTALRWLHGEDVDDRESPPSEAEAPEAAPPRTDVPKADR